MNRKDFSTMFSDLLLECVSQPDPMLHLLEKKTSSTNMLERLNREIRRRTRTVGIFPNEESYTRLVTMYLFEYSEDWSVNRGGYFSPEAVRSILDANAA